MSSIDKVAAVYEIALEKRAMEEVYETYGVDGYLPPGYAGAFFEMEKNAGIAPGGVFTALRRGLANTGSGLVKNTRAAVSGGKAGIGDTLKNTAGKGMMWAARNPGTTAAIGGGVALGGAMLAGRNRN